ncbi:MAG: hypothetical protein QW255_04835 [Candidatus Bilamarchaeaceae archaeon]
MIILPYIFVGNIYGSFRDKIYHSFDVLFKNTKRPQKIKISLSFIKNGIKNKKIGFSSIYQSSFSCDDMLWLGKTCILKTNNKESEKVIVVLDCYFTNINNEIYTSVFLQALLLCEDDIKIMNCTYLPFINLHSKYNVGVARSKNVINEEIIKLNGEDDFMLRRYKKTIDELKTIYANSPVEIVVNKLANMFSKLAMAVGNKNFSKYKSKKEFLYCILKVYFTEYKKVVYSAIKDTKFFAKNFMQLASLNFSKENIKIFTLSKNSNSFFERMFFEPIVKYYDNQTYCYSHYFYDKLEGISKIWFDVNQKIVIIRSESFVESNISTLVYLIPNALSDLYILHDESGEHFIPINLSKRYASKLLNKDNLDNDLFIKKIMQKAAHVELYKKVKINIFSYENSTHYEIKRLMIVKNKNYDYIECYLFGNYDNDVNIFYLHLSSQKNPFVFYPIMQIVNECSEDKDKMSLYSNKVFIKFEIVINDSVQKYIVLRIHSCNQNNFLFLHFSSKEFAINKVSIKDNYNVKNYYNGGGNHVLTINMLYDHNDTNANKVKIDFNEMINIIKSDITQELTYITLVFKVTNEDLSKIMESNKLVIKGVATKHYGSNYSNDIGLVFHETVL